LKRLFIVLLIATATALVAFGQDKSKQDDKPESKQDGGDSWNKFGQEIKQLETDWVAAHLQTATVTYTLERILAPDYKFTNADGAAKTRAQFISDFAFGRYAYDVFEISDVTRTVHSKKATISGQLIVQGTYTTTDKEQDLSGTYRFTNTYKKQGSRWQMTSTQLTLPPQE
jgi:hypothetical protein